MDSATILTNLTRIPLGPVDLSDLNNFSTRREDLAVGHFSELEISRAIVR